MPVLPDDLSIVKQECAGELKWITDRSASAEPLDDSCFETALPDLKVEDLLQFCATKAEFVIESRPRITETCDIIISPAAKKSVCLFFCAHVDERDPRSCRFDRLAA